MYKVIFCVLSALFFGAVHSFSVSGNSLLDSNGNPILLRGVDRPSLEWTADGQYLTLSDYTLMSQWGANVVRLSLNQCFWAASSSYATTVDQQVTWIKSLGMAVILDLHWSDQGGLTSCGQQLMADSNSVTFWTQVATKYANDSLVLFELYNEPHDVSWSVWLSGGDTGAGWSAVGMQTLYNTVRATGADNVVIAGGLNWAYDLSGVPSYGIDGYNIMYNTHVYLNTGKMPSDWPTGFGFLASSQALIATEFGDYTCNGSYYQSFIDYANENSMSYTAWGWFVSGCSFPSLINDWTGTPSASGVVVKNDLLTSSKIPGVTTGSTIAASVSSAGSSGSNTGNIGNSGGGNTGSGVNLPIYADSVENFADWSWASARNPSDTTFVHSGLYSYSFVPNNYGAIYFYEAGGITTTEYQGVEFWVNGGTSGGQNVNFNLIRYDGTNSNKIGPDNSVASYTSSGTVPAQTWVRGYVDFSAFPSGSYDGFWFIDQAGSTQGSIYFDDITLIAFSSTSAATTTTATATTAAVTTAAATTAAATTAAATTAAVTTVAAATAATTSVATTAATTTIRATTAAATTAAATTAAATTAAATTAAATTAAATTAAATTASTTTSATIVAATTATKAATTAAATTAAATTAAATTAAATTAAATTAAATTAAATTAAATTAAATTAAATTAATTASTTAAATTAAATASASTTTAASTSSAAKSSATTISSTASLAGSSTEAGTTSVSISQGTTTTAAHNSTCRIGSERCACGEICDPGLLCLENVCISGSGLEGVSSSPSVISYSTLLLGVFIVLALL